MTEYNKLINDVNNGKFSPIYLIHGEENYFINNIIENITRNVINETSADFDLKKIYGKKSDESQENDIIDFVKRFPLSGDYNLLIAKDSKNISTDFKNIISYIENNNPKTILVLSFTNNVDKRKKIYKSSLKNGVVFESKKIYDNQVYNWIQEQCKSKSLNLHPNSIKIIEDFTGNDLSQIDNELEKLKLNSIKDDDKFEINSIEILYSLPINTFTLIADNQDDIYVAKIVSYTDEAINQNSENFNTTSNEASAQNRNSLLKSYDYLLNVKYKVIVNEKTLDRVKNYFR